MTKRTPATERTSLSAKNLKDKKPRSSSRRRTGGLQYQSLEQRLPLDASFEFAGGVLTIDGFNEETQLTVTVAGELTATIDGDNWQGDFVPGLDFPGINDDGDELGNRLVATDVTELVINSTGFGAPEARAVINFQGGETLDTLAIDVTGNIILNSNGNDFDLLDTTLITDADLTQSNNRPNVSEGITLGNLSFQVGGNALFDDFAADQFGGEVAGNLVINSAVGDLTVIDQFGANFIGSNGNGIDALYVGGNASITSGSGNIGQAPDSPIVIGGLLDISTAAVFSEDEGIMTTVDLSGSSDNDFSEVNIVSRTNTRNVLVRVFDHNSFSVQNASSGTTTHLAAGRNDAGDTVRSRFNGGLTLTGNVRSPNVILQASTGFTQENTSNIDVSLLQLGGIEISEGRGDFIFDGDVEGFISDGLRVFDFSTRVRGNLDFSTSSEITLVSAPIIYPDGRPDELFEDSWADGDARINANRIDFDASFETTKFVLTVESDVTQDVDTSVISEQLYVSGKEIDLSNNTNDTGQLAARGVGDESFIRFSDVGTFRIVSLDGSIEGASASTIADPATINGLLTDRIPEIGIGVQSFIDISTGFGGTVDDPRVGVPPVELDNVEKFEVIRDDTRAQFLTDEFGEDGRGVFFIEFIYDGVSPFEFTAESNQFDAELALYDEVGNLVFVSDDPSLSVNANITNEDIEGGLPAGRYYLASAAFSATFGDDFDVQTEFDDGVPTQPTGTLLITLESPGEDPDELYEDLLVRLESFIAPEVRRSFFQNDDAPIDTEKLFVSVLEDGSINFTGPQNRIDELCIFETDDFVLNSTTTINIDTLTADGNVLLTAPGQIIVNDLNATGDVDIATPARVIGQNLSSGGDIRISGDRVNLEEVTSGGDVDITATNTALLTEFDVVGEISAASSSDDIVVDGVRAQGNVNLAAADDIRLAAPEGIRRLQGADLFLFADNINNDNLNGVFLYTDVDSVTSRVERGGQVFINERTDIESQLTANNGPITLQANGNITGNASVSLPGHDITLIARGDGSDIDVESVTVLGSNDNVRLFAEDDITANVQAGNLLAQALNNVDDQDVAVQLDTTVRTLNVSAGIMSDGDANRGDIVVNESNPLILTRAVAAHGQISVSAEGNIVTGNVQSNRISTGNAIEIAANGTGSDLSTARIVVRDGTGGVVLTAGDDIVDGDINDRLAVVAHKVTYQAGNNTVDSFNGVIGHSFAKEISVTTTSNTETGVFLFNTGNTTVSDTVISNGQFSLTNRSGAVRIDDISILSQQLSNRVFVKTSGTGGDILVGSIDAGLNGIVTLDAADDVLDTDLLDELFIRGEFLNVTARNNKVDSFDGIILNIDVENFADRALNGGETFVQRQA